MTIEKQISQHVDDKESYCPQCESTVTEIGTGQQLQCDDIGCSHVFDNNRG